MARFGSVWFGLVRFNIGDCDGVGAGVDFRIGGGGGGDGGIVSRSEIYIVSIEKLLAIRSFGAP